MPEAEEPVCDADLVHCDHYRCQLHEEIRAGNALAELVWILSVTMVFEGLLLAAIVMRGG